MKTKQHWKSGTRLDSVMNARLIVLALGMLGAGAWENSAITTTTIEAAGQQRV